MNTSYSLRKRVMVTGGAGFLGSHLCDRLIADGHDVLCVDNFFTGTKDNILHLLDSPHFELMRHDVTFPLYVEVDELYNLACPASPIHSQFDPVQTTKTSVHGAINMLGLAKRTKAKIFQASTSEVYGDPDVHPQTEHYSGESRVARESVRGLLRPDGLAPWRRPVSAPVRPAPGHAVPRRAPEGRGRAAHGPTTNGSTACRMRSAYRLRGFATRPLRPCGGTHAPTPTGGRSASLRSPCLAGGHVNPVGPRSCYDEGKRCAETLFFDYHRQHHLRIKVARIFNTYGPRMHPNDGRVVSNFIVQALKGQCITIYGDGSQTRSFCYVDDLIEAFVRLMNTPDDFTGPVNIGNPGEFTIRQLAEKVVEMTGSRSQITYEPLPMDDPTQRQPDITLARERMCWEPTIALEAGLAKTIAYFEQLLMPIGG